MTQSKYHAVILYGNLDETNENCILALLERYGKRNLVCTRAVDLVAKYLKDLESDIAWPDTLVLTDLNLKSKTHPNLIPLTSIPTLTGPLVDKDYGYYDDGWHGCEDLEELKEALTKTATALFSPEGTTYNFPSVLGHHLSCDGKCKDKCWW